MGVELQQISRFVAVTLPEGINCSRQRACGRARNDNSRINEKIRSLRVKVGFVGV